MEYTFINRYNDIFRFEDFIKRAYLKPDDISVKLENKYVQSGIDKVVKSGSGYKKPFEIKLDYTILTKDDVTSDLVINYLYSFFMQDSPYYIIDSQTNKRTEIQLDGVREKHKEGMKKRFTTLTLDFTQIGMYWEQIHETIGSKILQPGDSIDVPLMFYCDMNPIRIELTNLTNVSNSKFNISLENKEIRRNILINEIGFTQNKTIVIDSTSTDGVIQLMPDSVNIKKNVLFGSPFVLYKGNNIITYSTSINSAIELRYSYRERTIV